MTTIMNQVACSPCDIKIDEVEWMEHLVSTNPLQLCKKNAIKFIKMIFNASPKESKLYDLKIEKTQDFCQLYFSTNYRRKNSYLMQRFNR